LKLGRVVLLNSPPKPIDFGPNRFRGKGAGGKKTKFGTPSISLYRMKLHSSNLVCTWILGCSCPQTRNWPPQVGVAWGTCPILKFKFGTPSISLYRMKLHSSNLVCTWILGCSCPQTKNWPPKWAWPGVRAQFRNFGTPSISLYRMKLHSSNLVCPWILGCSCPQTRNWPPSGRGLGYVPNF